MHASVPELDALNYRLLSGFVQSLNVIGECDWPLTAEY